MAFRFAWRGGLGRTSFGERFDVGSERQQVSAECQDAHGGNYHTPGGKEHPTGVGKEGIAHYHE
jgi:hypothetical protein